MSEKSSSARKSRIFIVDDHAVVRLGLASRLAEEKDLVVCGEAADAVEALEGISETRPDVAIIDLSLRRSSGIELIKDVAIQCPEVKMVVLSMHDEMMYAERVLRAGASAYVMKEDSSQQVVAAVRHVLAGKVFVSDRVMTAIAARLGKRKIDSSPVERLSDRELQVFELIGEGLSSSEIAERMHLSIKTVQMYFARAKEKFGVTSAKELLREAFRWHDQR